MDTTKIIVGGIAVGALYLATKGEKAPTPDAPTPELQTPVTPNFAPLRPVQQISTASVQNNTLVPQGMVREELMVQPEGGAFVALDQGKDVIMGWPLQVTGERLIQYIKAGDKRVFQKPYTARQVNVSAYTIVNGDRVLDKSKPNAKADNQIGRMTVTLDTWESYRFFGSLLGIGYVTAGAQDAASRGSGLGLLEWFAYHRWHIGDNLRAKMLEVAYNTSCHQKYERGPAHGHRNYQIQWNQKIDEWGQTVDVRTTRGNHGFHKAYPAFKDWGYARDGRYPLEDTQDMNKRIPLVPKACFGQDDLPKTQVMREFEVALGLEFWGMSSNGRAMSGPCGALVEYAAARYAQIGFCSAINPALGQAAGSALLNAAKQAAGLALGVIGSVIAGASTVPVAGWIAAGVAALIAAVGGIFSLNAAIDNNRKARVKVSDLLDQQLKQSWTRFGLAGGIYDPDNGGVLAFSGHRLGLLIPNHEGAPIDDRAFWSEITDPLFSHFAMSSTRAPVSTIPQMPAHYLGIDFELPVSVIQPLNNLVVLAPIFDTDGVTVDSFDHPMRSFPEYQAYLTKFAAEYKAPVNTAKEATQPSVVPPYAPPFAPPDETKSNSAALTAGGILFAALLLAQSRR